MNEYCLKRYAILLCLVLLIITMFVTIFSKGRDNEELTYATFIDPVTRNYFVMRCKYFTVRECGVAAKQCNIISIERNSLFFEDIYCIKHVAVITGEDKKTRIDGHINILRGKK